MQSVKTCEVTKCRSADHLLTPQGGRKDNVARQLAITHESVGSPSCTRQLFFLNNRRGGRFLAPPAAIGCKVRGGECWQTARAFTSPIHALAKSKCEDIAENAEKR